MSRAPCGLCQLSSDSHKQVPHIVDHVAIDLWYCKWFTRCLLYTPLRKDLRRAVRIMMQWSLRKMPLPVTVVSHIQAVAGYIGDMSVRGCQAIEDKLLHNEEYGTVGHLAVDPDDISLTEDHVVLMYV